MSRRAIVALVAAGAALACGLGPAVGAARACGLPLEATMPAEKALVSYADGRQEITWSVTLDTEKPDAAVIFPVPGVPRVAEAPRELFRYLEAATAPKIETVKEERSSGDDETAGGAPPRTGVDVLGRETIGDYDVARLAADDPRALERWLRENRYTVPAKAQPILDDYVAENWKFVAVKLANAGAEQGELAPLRVSFPSQEIVYPVRLDYVSGQPMSMDLWFLWEHRLVVPPLEPRYAGPVADLERPVPAELRDLFPEGAPYITRAAGQNIDPERLEEDIVPAQAPSDEAFRATETRVEFVEPGSLGGDGDDGASAWLIALVIAAVGVLAVGAILLWRRMRAS
jgi:hypothetical protein